MQLNYDDAMALLREHNKNESLVRHGIAVSAASEAYARKFGEDALKFRVAGVLHGVDYEEDPTVEEDGRVGTEGPAAPGYPGGIGHVTPGHKESLGHPR